MRITKKDGSHVSAKGSASGSVDGKVSFKIHTVNGSKATATFYGHNAHGTISGTGVAKYHVSGAVSYYTGKIKTLTGTGKYAQASSQGISLSGTVNRRTYDVKMTLTGRWHA
jgi:polyisoprenoid-binding protein YceI